jgi:hypothetical protein
VLYDADAKQRYGVTVQHKGKRYPVFYEFNPITDETFIEYDRQRDVRMASDGTGGIDSRSNGAAAAAMLGRVILLSVEGWGPADGSKVKDRQLADAVQNGPLACAVDQKELPLGNAEEDRPWDEDEDVSNTYVLRTMFNGGELICTHVLTDADAAQESRWTKLMAKTKLLPGERLTRRDIQIPSRAKAIGKLYDEMYIRSEGYAGRIPLWHKLEVMNEHMGVQQEMVDEGK